MYNDVHEEESSLDVSSPRDNNSPIVCFFINIINIFFIFYIKFVL